VILVEPRHPGNVGFCARLLANFGLADWVLVGGVDWRDSEAERTGGMAREVLEAARRASSLAEAARGCTHLLGLTARAGRHRRPRPLQELGRLRRAWGPGARPALVLGREDRGLEEAEAEACTELLRIPTRGLHSLNLSHALAVALWEWFREEAEDTGGPGAVRWAGVEEKDRLLARAREELAAAGFPGHPDHLEGTLRRLAARPLEARDLQVLECILRHVRWRREGSGPAHPEPPGV